MIDIAIFLNYNELFTPNLLLLQETIGKACTPIADRGRIPIFVPHNFRIKSEKVHTLCCCRRSSFTYHEAYIASNQ